MRTQRRAPLLLVLVVVGTSASAHADQPGFALDRFEPAEAGSRWLLADSLSFGNHGLRAKAPESAFETLVLKLGANVASDPLVVARGGTVAARVVSMQSTGTLGGSITLFDRVRLGLAIPVQLYADGTRAADPRFAYQAPASSAALGDVRFGAHVRILGESEEGVRVAIGGVLRAPSGDASAYAGAGSWRGEPQVLAAGERGAAAWALSAGLPVSSGSWFGGLAIGNEIVATAALGYLTEDRRFLVGPELRVVTSLEGEVFTRRRSTYEPTLGAHYGFAEGWRLHVGAGTGVGDGLGSPTWRASFALQWAPIDGTPRGATPTDRDGDGVTDDRDACADVPGVPSADRTLNGCPPPAAPRGVADRDGDGIPDSVDACIEEPGVESDNVTKHGCPVVAPLPPPLDSDGDRIPDAEDACPREPGPRHPDAKKNGCPVGALVGGELVLDNVRFKTGSDVILKESDETLGKVLATIQKLPASQRFLVEGHTDDRGAPAQNKDLSARRAKSVVQWFVKKGIAASRFDAAGFGMERPIATNDTEAGRASNRRVEIHLVGASKR